MFACCLLSCTQTQIASHYCGPKHAKRLKAPDAPDAKIGACSEPVATETTLQSPSLSCSPSFSNGASEGGTLHASLTSLQRPGIAPAALVRCVCSRPSSRDVLLLHLCGCRGGDENNTFCCELNTTRPDERCSVLLPREFLCFQFWRSIWGSGGVSVLCGPFQRRASSAPARGESMLTNRHPLDEAERILFINNERIL